jgi:hypothetical protein
MVSMPQMGKWWTAQNGRRRRAGDEGRATNGGRQTAGTTAGDGGGSHGTSIRLEWEHGQPADAIRRAIVQNVAAGVGHYSPGRTIYHHQLARGSAGERIASLTHLYCRKLSDMIVSSRRDSTASGPVDSPDGERRTGWWGFHRLQAGRFPGRRAAYPLVGLPT